MCADFGTSGTDYTIVIKAFSWDKSSDSKYLGEFTTSLSELMDRCEMKESFLLVDVARRETDKTYSSSGQVFVDAATIVEKERTKDDEKSGSKRVSRQNSTSALNSMLSVDSKQGASPTASKTHKSSRKEKRASSTKSLLK